MTGLAKDVEYNITAQDKSGMALKSAEDNLRRFHDKMAKESDKSGGTLGKNLGKGLIDGLAKISPKFASGLTDVVGMAGKAAGPALAIGLAAATPLIGATVSAAVIGGAGLGGVLGGVALAARDPRVKQAGTQLGQNLLGMLENEAQASFVEPLLRNIGKIETRFEGLRGRLNRIFANSAEFLDPLVDGVLDAVDGITRGVDALVANAGPTMTSLGQVIGGVGQALGEAFEMIAAGGDDAAYALKFLGFILITSIQSFGFAVRSLTEFFGLMVDLAKPTIGLAGALGLLDEKTTKAADAALSAAPATSQLQAAVTATGDAAVAAASPVATFTDQVNNLATAGRTAFDSLTQVGAATDAASKALRENGRTLDANTDKGRANRTALSGLASALVAQYNATVQVNGEGRESNRVAGENRAAFVRLATQFGLSRAAAERLASQMGLIPAKKKTDFTANTHDAEGRIQALKERIAGVHGKTVSVNVAVNAPRLASIENRLNRLGGSMYNSSAAGGWQPVEGGGGARTGGPAPISVTNNVAVSLDGQPFYAMAYRVVRDQSESDRWRAKIGSV